MQDATNSGLNAIIKQEPIDHVPDSGLSSSSPIPTNPNNTSSSSNSSLPENFNTLHNFSNHILPPHSPTIGNLLPPLQMPPPPIGAPPHPIPAFNYNNTSLFNQHFRNGAPNLVYPPNHHNIFGLFKNNGQVCNVFLLF